MRLDSTLKKVVPDISRPKKSRHYFDALDEREIGRSFSDSRAFMAMPVSYYEKLYYTWQCKFKRNSIIISSFFVTRLTEILETKNIDVLLSVSIH